MLSDLWLYSDFLRLNFGVRSKEEACVCLEHGFSEIKAFCVKSVFRLNGSSEKVDGERGFQKHTQ